jgi:cytochrome P450 family 135
MTPTAAPPPGPRLPAWLQTAVMIRFWPRAVAACRRRYGDVFTLRIAGEGTVVYLADPAAIKTVFAGDPRIFHAGEANAMLAGILGEDSVLIVDEDVHRDRRRLMLAPFARDPVARLAPVIAEIAAADIARWPVGREFAVSPRFCGLTLEVIMRTVIGATDPARLDALRRALPRVLDIGPWTMAAVARPELQQRLPWRYLRRRIAEADRLLYAEIAERRADPDLERRTDVLAMLVRAAGEDGRQMTDSELRDQLMTLLAAGHDTTATALSWALERLTRHPAELARAVEAANAAAAGDPAGAQYLEALAKETLRIRSVVFDVGRTLTAPVEVAGYRLPAGVMVAPGIGLVHSSAAVYDDPERFDPGRMLGATLSPTTWLPFGGGNRRCLGAGFAMAEMTIVLREVLRRVDLATTTAPGERRRVRGVVLEPHRGARIRVIARRDVPLAAPHRDRAGGCPVAG